MTSVVQERDRFRFGGIENAVLLVAASLLLSGAVLWSVRGSNVEKTDFSVTYVGAWMVSHGRGAHLYDLQEQAKVKAAHFTRAEPLIYEHPPFEAFFLAPLARLPYRMAYLIWGFFNVIIWVGLPCILRFYLPVPRDPLAYFTLWLLFAPLDIALYQGQSSLVLLLLYALAYIELKRGRDFRGGLILGLGLFKFQFVLPFALVFLLRRKLKFVKGFALSAAFLGTISWIAVGWSGMYGYANLLLTAASHPENLSFGRATDMATIYAFLHAVLGQHVSQMSLTVMVGLVSAFLVLLATWQWNRQEREPKERSFDLTFAMTVIVSLATGLHMFAHDMSPLVLALLLVAAHFPKPERAGLRLALGTLLALFWIPPLYITLIAFHATYLWCGALLIFGLCTLMLATESSKPMLTARQVAAQ